MSPKILYVLGNGFDLHHGIKSSYQNYRDWLEINNPSILAEINEIYGEPDNPWWKSFEENLTVFKTDFSNKISEMSEASLVSKLNELVPDLLSEIEEHGSLSKPALERCYAQTRASRLVENIKDSFSDWVKSIDIDKPKSEVFLIDPNENLLALVFNYTRTLERVYAVDYPFVNHIHGKVKDEDDDSDWHDPREFILGHGMTADDMLDRDWKDFVKDNTCRTSCFNYDEDEGKDNIAHIELYSAISDMRKPVDDLIVLNSTFWDSLFHIERVVLAGMSFSSIDEKYLDTIFDRVPIDAQITIYYYDEIKDIKNAMTYMQKVNRVFCLVKW